MADQRIGVGFGTAGLGGDCFQSVTSALDAGFRKFDTAEAEYWYDQETVGNALEAYFQPQIEQECQTDDETYCTNTCRREGLEISTKIPPWQLTSIQNIRVLAESSRRQLVRFCDDETIEKFPLDVYYIHAPMCWEGWHPRCDGVREADTLPLREAWLGMEAVVQDGNAKRIGLSNVWPNHLLDLIYFVQERQRTYTGEGPPPRMPDVLQAYADPLSPSLELREICKEHGIEFVSYSTLGTQHSMRGGGNPVLTNANINEIAASYEKSAAEVVLSWAIQHDMSVIPRSRNRRHIMELSNMLTSGPFLGTHDMDIIDSLSSTSTEL